MQPPPEQTPPLLFGPVDVTEGYYELEAVERRSTLDALLDHRDAVALWYRSLTLYRRGVLGQWDFGVEEGDPRLPMLGLRSQLLGLGVSSAKAALDMLLAGYYSIAYAAIRHMLESFAQYLYVAIHPDEARLWYEQPGGLAAQKEPPRMLTMVQAIKAHPEFRGTQVPGIFDKVYASWLVMSNGAHPSGAGITQTVGDGSGKYLVGATYRRDLCLAGFDHGLFALMLLQGALNELRPQEEAWVVEWVRVRKDTGAWREQVAAEVEAAQGELPPEAPEAPGPSREDVKRAWRTIAAWEANATSMRLPAATSNACAAPQAVGLKSRSTESSGSPRNRLANERRR